MFTFDKMTRLMCRGQCQLLNKLASGPVHAKTQVYFSELFSQSLKQKKIIASAGNQTRVNCLEGSYAHHYTTDALM